MKIVKKNCQVCFSLFQFVLVCFSLFSVCFSLLQFALVCFSLFQFALVCFSLFQFVPSLQISRSPSVQMFWTQNFKPIPSVVEIFPESGFFFDPDSIFYGFYYTFRFKLIFRRFIEARQVSKFCFRKIHPRKIRPRKIGPLSVFRIFT